MEVNVTKITFLLPAPTAKIVGGLKVIYQYANYLAQNNHEVILSYLNSGNNSRNIPQIICKAIRYLILLKEPQWYSLDSRIKKKIYTNALGKETDYIVATSVETAPIVYQASCEKKIYFIQDFENWHVSNLYVNMTYKLDMKKVVISEWLIDIVRNASSVDPIYIPNGIDLSTYSYKTDINARDISIAMLYHNDERKASHIGIDVILRLKTKYPSIKAYLFGSSKRPPSLPTWIDYTEKATTEETVNIYNRSMIFLCTSRYEGYGLPGLESMACGCAMVSTDSLGVQEYAINGYNSIICEVDDVDALYRACVHIIDDRNVLNHLSSGALRTVADYDIKKSLNLFLDLFNDKC